MKKLKGLIIVLSILLSLFGLTACGGDNNNSYEQITPQEAKTIMDTENDILSSMPAPPKNLPKDILKTQSLSPNTKLPKEPKKNYPIRNN